VHGTRNPVGNWQYSAGTRLLAQSVCQLDTIYGEEWVHAELGDPAAVWAEIEEAMREQRVPERRTAATPRAVLA
jgi:hypothetical protein